MTTKKMVLVYLVNWDQVLLGLKKSRINAGYLTGPGGHLEADESAEQAAVREVREELGVTISPRDLRFCGMIESVSVLERHQVVVYTVSGWTGQLRESDEIVGLGWFPISDLPIEQLRPSDAPWLGRMLSGEVLRVYLRFLRTDELDVFLVTRYTGANPA